MNNIFIDTATGHGTGSFWIKCTGIWAISSVREVSGRRLFMGVWVHLSAR